MKTKTIFVIPMIIILSMIILPSMARADMSVIVITGDGAGQWPASGIDRTRYLTTDGAGIQFICPDDIDQLMNFGITDGSTSYNPYCGDPTLSIPAGDYTVVWYGESPYSQYDGDSVTVYSPGAFTFSEVAPPTPTDTPTVAPTFTPTDIPPTITVFPPTDTPTIVIINTPTPTDTPTIAPTSTPELPPGVLYLPSVYSQASILKMLAFIFIKLLLVALTETGENNMLKRIHSMILVSVFIGIDMLFYPYIAYTNDDYILPLVFILYIIIKYYRDMVEFLTSLTH